MGRIGDFLIIGKVNQKRKLVGDGAASFVSTITGLPLENAMGP